MSLPMLLILLSFLLAQKEGVGCTTLSTCRPNALSSPAGASSVLPAFESETSTGCTLPGSAPCLGGSAPLPLDHARFEDGEVASALQNMTAQPKPAFVPKGVFAKKQTKTPSEATT